VHTNFYLGQYYDEDLIGFALEKCVQVGTEIYTEKVGDKLACPFDSSTNMTTDRLVKITPDESITVLLQFEPQFAF
jgi:hypothetical protein